VRSRFHEPRYTAAHPDGRHAFVSDSGSGELVVLDAVRGRVVARVSVGAKARHLSIDPTGRRLWTALGTKAERIAIVDVADPSSPRLIETIRAPFLAHDVVFAASGNRVWVSSGDRGSLAIYDASTRRLVRTLAGQAPPQHVAFSERGRVAYVTSGDDASLRVHAHDGRLLREASVPGGSYNVSRGGGHVFTPSLDRGTLCLLDRNGNVRHTVSVAASSHDAAVVS
jgi:YVTN family beta-propeller protein